MAGRFHNGPGLLIKGPLNLGRQVFRINRGIPRPVRGKPGQTTWVMRPGFWEDADCERAECPHYNFGWTTLVDPATPLGKGQMHYIRKVSGRSFREEPSGQHQGALLLFTFEPGQKCFRAHKLPVLRDPIFSNLARGRETADMDYDRFFDTFNEVSTQQRQKRRVV